MNENVGKLSMGLILLVGVWIAVYTLWQPSEPPITFATTPAPEPVTPPVPTAIEHPSAVVSAAPVAEESKATPPQTEAAASKPPPAVLPPQFSQYTVKKGDTLQSISRQFFGSPAYAASIGRANPFMDPSQLRPGRVIRVPRDPDNIQGRPRPGSPAPVISKIPVAATQSYVVKPGDTLSKISQTVYGSSVYATRLYEANTDKLKSPDDLRVGTELIVPPLDKPR